MDNVPTGSGLYNGKYLIITWVVIIVTYAVAGLALYFYGVR